MLSIRPRPKPSQAGATGSSARRGGCVPAHRALGAQRRVAHMGPGRHRAGTAPAVRRPHRLSVWVVVAGIDVSARDAHRIIGERREGDGEVDRVSKAARDGPEPFGDAGAARAVARGAVACRSCGEHVFAWCTHSRTEHMFVQPRLQRRRVCAGWRPGMRGVARCRRRCRRSVRAARLAQRPAPSELQASSLVLIRPITSVVNALVEAEPPRSAVRTPAAVASRTDS